MQGQEAAVSAARRLVADEQLLQALEVRVVEQVIDQAVQQVIERGGGHGGQTLNVRSMQASSPRRMRRSISDTAFGELPRSAATSFTHPPGW